MLKMELKFTKEQMILILKEYYKNYFDIEGEIEIKAYASQVGYEMYPSLDTVVEMKIVGDMDINNMKTKIEQKITTDDLENAFSYILSSKNIDVEGVKLDKGITSISIGYGLGEKNVETAYFKGVKVTTKNNNKNLGGM